MDHDILQRHKAFWGRQETDRPLFGINSGFFLQQRFPRVIEHMPQGTIGPDDIPVDLFLQECDALYESHRELGDYPFVSSTRLSAFPGWRRSPAVRSSHRLTTSGPSPASAIWLPGSRRRTWARTPGCKN